VVPFASASFCEGVHAARAARSPLQGCGAAVTPRSTAALLRSGAQRPCSGRARRDNCQCRASDLRRSGTAPSKRRSPPIGRVSFPPGEVPDSVGAISLCLIRAAFPIVGSPFSFVGASLPIGGASRSLVRPAFPIGRASFPFVRATFPSGGAPCSLVGASFPFVRASFPTVRASLSFVIATVPICNALLSFVRATFPLVRVSFPLVRVSFPIGRAPIPIGEAPWRIGRTPFPIGRASLPIGRASLLMNNDALPIGKASFLIGEASPLACRATVTFRPGPGQDIADTSLVGGASRSGPGLRPQAEHSSHLAGPWGIPRRLGRMRKVEEGTEMRNVRNYRGRAGPSCAHDPSDCARGRRAGRHPGRIGPHSAQTCVNWVQRASLPHFGSLFHLPHSPQEARNGSNPVRVVTNAQPAGREGQKDDLLPSHIVNRQWRVFVWGAGTNLAERVLRHPTRGRPLRSRAFMRAATSWPGIRAASGNRNARAAS
jgi:hypothetical protein